MRRIISSALVIVACPTLAAAQAEFLVGGGVGFEVFDDEVLTYPVAEVGATHWWGGWGMGGRGSFQVGTVLHPYARHAGPFWRQPSCPQLAGVSGAMQGSLYGRRRWFPGNAEIDLGIGWAVFARTDSAPRPGTSIHEFRSGGHRWTWEAFYGRAVSERVSVKGGLSCSVTDCKVVALASFRP